MSGYLLRISHAGAELGEYAVRPLSKLRIGRAPECDVAIEHPTVSRTHAILDVGPYQIEIRDADSSYGTWVICLHVQRQVVRAGDVIRVGAVEIEIRSTDTA